MEINFTFRNVDSSESVKDYARAKIAKMQKYLRAPLEADVVASVERHLQCIEVSVRADGERFAGSQESESMYAAIDLVIDKLERQAREAKNVATDRMRHSGGVSQMSGKFDK